MKGFIKFNIPATSIHTKEDEILTICRNHRGDELSLLRLNPISDEIVKVATFNAQRNLLLNEAKDKMFAGVDNKLLTSDDLASWKVVLESRNPSNLFWHMAVSESAIYVQEYGEPPTGIYMSDDGENWELLTTALEIDKKAKHFHNIAYDPYRDMLIVTLGDSNLVRIAISQDGGRSWRPAYKGAWQTIPIVVLDDCIVFGMDSGIARGGTIIWEPSHDKWQVIHIKRKDGGKFMQMSDLKLLSNNIWVAAAVGAPQALLASHNLKDWYQVYMENPNNYFNHSMVSEGKSIAALATGKDVIVMEKDYINEQIKRRSPVCNEHKAVWARLLGLVFLVKRKVAYL